VAGTQTRSVKKRFPILERASIADSGPGLSPVPAPPARARVAAIDAELAGRTAHPDF